MPPKARFLWIGCGITLSLVLPVVGTHHLRSRNSARTTCQRTDSLTAGDGGRLIGDFDRRNSRGQASKRRVAGVLSLGRQRGLASMGLLGLFHASVPVGDTFVWLESVACILGGLLFAFVWVGSPPPWTRCSRDYRGLPFARGYFGDRIVRVLVKHSCDDFEGGVHGCFAKFSTASAAAGSFSRVSSSFAVFIANTTLPIGCSHYRQPCSVRLGFFLSYRACGM